MNEMRVQRMVRELRADPVMQALEPMVMVMVPVPDRRATERRFADAVRVERFEHWGAGPA